MKKILLILFILTIISSCSRREYDFLANQKPYYEVTQYGKKTLVLKSTNGKTSNLRIKVWKLPQKYTENCVFIYHDSDAVFYDLGDGFYKSLAIQKTDELFENQYKKKELK